MRRHVASVSWGKDSLCMLLILLERHMPLDEVVFYDTGMEFKAIYDTRDRMLPRLKEAGIIYTELHPDRPMMYDMLERPKTKRNGQQVCGDGWCGGPCRWGTMLKLQALDAYIGTDCTYIGFAADEPLRLVRLESHKCAPLADWGITEGEALLRCYRAGFEWLEDGKPLYALLDRVSCWCCRNKNLKELRNIYQFLPQYWGRLRELQEQIPQPMKGAGKSIFELEERFKKEIFIR